MTSNFSAKTGTMRRIAKCIMPCFLAFFVCACNGIGFDNIFNKSMKIYERAQFKDVEFTGAVADGEMYSVIVISDLHFPSCHKTEFLQKIQEIDFTDYGKPEMVVALGDLANDGSHEQYGKYNAFASELKKQLSGAEVFAVPGNHDTYDSALNGKNYLQDVYPHTTFYRVKLHGKSWYFLDSADGTFGYEQIQSMENLFLSDGSPKVICTHYPLYADTMYYRLSNYKERAHVMSLFAKNNVSLYLCGHTHIAFKKDFGSFTQMICGSLRGDEEAPSFFILSFRPDGSCTRTVFTL